MDIPVELSRIMISETQDRQIIVLKEKDGRRAFPIVIGFFEAMAIDRKVKEQSTPRPMTHDLLHNCIKALGGRLVRVVICDMREGPFFANLYLEQGGHLLEIDARPSDAIALAVQWNADLYVRDEVLEQVAQREEADHDEEEESGEGA